MGVEVGRDKLQALIDAASEINSPHVDLAPILGVTTPVRVGVSDIGQALLTHDLPSFSVEIGDDDSIEVSHIDGGVLATWTKTF